MPAQSIVTVADTNSADAASKNTTISTGTMAMGTR